MGYILAIYCCGDDIVCVVCVFVCWKEVFDFIMYIGIVVLGNLDRGVCLVFCIDYICFFRVVFFYFLAKDLDGLLQFVGNGGWQQFM